MEEVEDYNVYEESKESYDDPLYIDPSLTPPNINTDNYLNYLK
jgi:hypothetical protein